MGVAVDATGNLFIADNGNNRIREVVFPGPTLVLNNVGGANAGSYDVVVSSPYGSVTSSVVSLVVLLPPTIVTEPQWQWVALGSIATLSVAASGTAPLDYQWYYDGAPLQGQTHTRLVLNAAAFTNAGSYSVVVTNLYGSVTSAVAVVNVGIPPGITEQPVGQTHLFNSAASFSVAVSGPGPITYQWQFNGTNIPEGVISTVAGNGTQGHSGDGGPATNAELNDPWGVAVDASGNLFIADNENNRIREVGTDGIIATVAGNGFGAPFSGGYSGEGGAATNAELYYPQGVAVDTFGNLFIADSANNRVRKVGTNGIITTVAGDGTAGYSGDGGAARNAELWSPAGVAVDASGNLFIADLENNRIRKVGTNGIITTVAGGGTNGLGDGGPATNAEVSPSEGVVVDATGNLFISDAGNQRIREVVFQGPTLVLTNVNGANAGAYDVVVSSPYGSVTSSVVTLVVALNPLNALSIGGQEVQLQFQGVPGDSYVLLSATNLSPPVDWRPIVTNPADTNGNWTFTVTNVLSDNAVFYRYRTSSAGE
jgi:hypothetical protein